MAGMNISGIILAPFWGCFFFPFNARLHELVIVNKKSDYLNTWLEQKKTETQSSCFCDFFFAYMRILLYCTWIEDLIQN